ncbi:F-box only protein 9-like [Amphibalanus amphitrite]|uniref:F-box only protein 9-like n=1 Tax=Amphibalanus amphitrite TaxID=1232801 RepID=UPI001C917CFF|nr:F-box only protein 9-like [Amphibalanus amphitrite]
MDGSGGSGSPGAAQSGSGVESAGDQEDDPSSSSFLTVLSETSESQNQQPALEDDLEQFRLRWKQEVSQQRQQQQQTAPTSAGSRTAAADTGSATKLDQAVELYMDGMRLEQRGLLYEAIQKYRRAEQTNAAVEEEVRRVLLARHQAQQQQQQQSQQQKQQQQHTDAPPAGDGGEDSDEEQEDSPEDVLRRLQQLSLQDARCCQPNVPQTARHISCLPGEVMQLITCWVVSSDLDVRSLDMLALVCRGFYRLARDNAVWKRICRRALGPGAAESSGPSPVWRELYLSRPHLHFNGCYISRASYIRGGELSGYQDHTYRPWHMVHYHRLLRFFADGQLLMLTSADEPAACVGQLQLQRPGTAVPGHYRLKGDRMVAVLSVPREASRRMKSGRVRLRRREMVQYDPGQQMLHIELDVQPFRLVWHSYKVVTVYSNGTESTHAIALNDQYPAMVFSRVRSYTTTSEAPLR